MEWCHGSAEVTALFTQRAMGSYRLRSEWGQISHSHYHQQHKFTAGEHADPSSYLHWKVNPTWNRESYCSLLIPTLIGYNSQMSLEHISHVQVGHL